MSVYVGIDQSYSGFAIQVFDPDGSNEDDQHWGTRWSWDPKKFGPGITRLAQIRSHFRSYMVDLSANYEIGHVCMEGYAHGAKNGREQAGELGAVVKLVLFDYLLDTNAAFPTIVPPSALKKFVTGKGNSTKDQMLLGVYKKYGVEFSDNNDADAYALSRVAFALSSNQDDLLVYEQQVISNLTRNTEQWESTNRSRATR